MQIKHEILQFRGGINAKSRTRVLTNPDTAFLAMCPVAPSACPPLDNVSSNTTHPLRAVLLERYSNFHHNEIKIFGARTELVNLWKDS